jgi:pantetheine-phosphate adenylyltransferase
MAAALPRVATYTGSFDPFHRGHENIVRRASKLFDRLLIGVGENPEKSPLFTAEERVAMIAGVLKDVPNVEVLAFRGLTVKFARERGAKVLLRGIRALSDIEYEFTMTLTNSNLDASLETVFLMACKEYSHLSSSLIRQVAQFGGDLAPFVPPLVQERLVAKYASTGRP